MKSIHILSVVEQVAEHIRSEIVSQCMQGEIPGIHQLAAELSVNHKTVKAALELLQKDGLLESQGSGKPRRILNNGKREVYALRIAMLLYDQDDRKVDNILNAMNHLIEAGHKPFFVKKTLVELNMKTSSVSRLVNRTDADAWIVVAGSLPILKWFSEQPFPAFGYYGRAAAVPMPSAQPFTIPALKQAIHHLVSLGHKRVVMIAREDRRKPNPGFTEQMMLHELEKHGIPTGLYNLPDWEESCGGLEKLLDSLLRHTPPTAILTQGAELTTAVFLYCVHHGISIPQQLSVVSMDSDRTFAWSTPAVARIGFDDMPLIRRIVSWANNVARGHNDDKKITCDAFFIEGGTTGPPAK